MYGGQHLADESWQDIETGRMGGELKLGLLFQQSCCTARRQRCPGEEDGSRWDAELHPNAHRGFVLSHPSQAHPGSSDLLPALAPKHSWCHEETSSAREAGGAACSQLRCACMAPSVLGLPLPAAQKQETVKLGWQVMRRHWEQKPLDMSPPGFSRVLCQCMNQPGEGFTGLGLWDGFSWPLRTLTSLQEMHFPHL